MTIGPGRFLLALRACGFLMRGTVALRSCRFLSVRSEEHTSELQSRSDLVCRLLLEKKKKVLAYEVDVSAEPADDDVTWNIEKMCPQEDRSQHTHLTLKGHPYNRQ